MPTMLIIAIWFVVLAIALTVLLKSADYFVTMAGLLGKKFKIPSFIIGATVVAFGTSLPELAVGIISVLKDESDIVTGTVIGSNISNILFILGIGIAISSGFAINFKKFKVEYVLLAVSTLLCSYFLYDKAFSFIEALICCALLIIYLTYVVRFSQSSDDVNEEEELIDIDWKKYTLFVLSIFGVWIGAKYTTDAITTISGYLNLGNDVISQTVVALGTSLPELAVTFAAVKNKQFGIVLGNVIGSNIFNALAVLAIPALLGIATNHPYIVKDDSFNNFSIPLMIGATALLIIASLYKVTPKTFGILFILLYLFFMVGSFMKVNLMSLV